VEWHQFNQQMKASFLTSCLSSMERGFLLTVAFLLPVAAATCG
jgi:hypothetical protein